MSSESIPLRNYAGGRAGGREPVRIGVNLTSMIDVTFLLLIYFLLATEFKLPEEVYLMDLPPRAPSAAAADPFELPREPLLISIASVGFDPGNYSIRIHGPFEQPLTFDALHEFLSQKQINESNAGGQPLFEPDHPIVVQPSATTRWDHAMEAFNAAARARYTNILLARPE